MTTLPTANTEASLKAMLDVLCQAALVPLDPWGEL